MAKDQDLVSTDQRKKDLEELNRLEAEIRNADEEELRKLELEIGMQDNMPPQMQYGIDTDKLGEGLTGLYGDINKEYKVKPEVPSQNWDTIKSAFSNFDLERGLKGDLVRATAKNLGKDDYSTTNWINKQYSNQPEHYPGIGEYGPPPEQPLFERISAPIGKGKYETQTLSKQGDKVYPLDPKSFEPINDITDVTRDVLQGMGTAAAGGFGALAGSATGPGAMASGTGLATVANLGMEAGMQGLAEKMGITPYNPQEVATAGLVGGATNMLLGPGIGKKQIQNEAIKQILEGNQRGTIGQITSRLEKNTEGILPKVANKISDDFVTPIVEYLSNGEGSAIANKAKRIIPEIMDVQKNAGDYTKYSKALHNEVLTSLDTEANKVGQGLSTLIKTADDNGVVVSRDFALTEFEKLKFELKAPYKNGKYPESVQQALNEIQDIEYTYIRHPVENKTTVKNDLTPLNQLLNYAADKVNPHIKPYGKIPKVPLEEVVTQKTYNLDPYINVAAFNDMRLGLNKLAKTNFKRTSTTEGVGKVSADILDEQIKDAVKRTAKRMKTGTQQALTEQSHLINPNIDYGKQFEELNKTYKHYGDLSRMLESYTSDQSGQGLEKLIMDAYGKKGAKSDIHKLEKAQEIGKLTNIDMEDLYNTFMALRVYGNPLTKAPSTTAGNIAGTGASLATGLLGYSQNWPFAVTAPAMGVTGPTTKAMVDNMLSPEFKRKLMQAGFAARNIPESLRKLPMGEQLTPAIPYFLTNMTANEQK